MSMLLAGCAPTDRAAGERAALPHLRDHGTTKQLIVDGAPFLILGGELGNSEASDLARLEAAWPRFDSLHLNTILAPVSWELIEPAEGQFDFRSVEGLVRLARRHGQRLVLLWFGSWKNSMSSYVPGWVKRDQARFPRSELPDGRGLEMLSPFYAANRDAEARAFVALMRWLRENDGVAHTVIMVQVDNEIGMIPNARDHSDTADALFRQPVPAPLLAAVTLPAGARTGWADVFGRGPEGEEHFMAWHYATYIEAIAAAGKAEYPLPMFVNAALIRPGRKPGEYPSAGPLPHLFATWRAAAPSIDFFAPDIYFPNFVEWASAYRQPGNPLFVPETGRQPEATPANALYAVGALDAMGFSPFAIDDYATSDRLGQGYDLLEQLTPLILEHQGQGTMTGVRPPVNFDGATDAAPQDVRLGRFTLHVVFRDPWGPAQQAMEAHGGLIIQLGPEEFLVAGRGLTITFAADSGQAGIETIHEGRFVGGRWVPGRLLNGDESHQGRHLRIPHDTFAIQRVRLYPYR